MRWKTRNILLTYCIFQYNALLITKNSNVKGGMRDIFNIYKHAVLLGFKLIFLQQETD